MAQILQSEKQAKGQTEDGSNPDGLSQQYGGVHAGGWVDLLPVSWIPYIQLSRLSPPAGLFLIYFPHIFGVLHAASVHDFPLQDVLRVSLVLLGGSFFCNNASHAWNDLIDAPIDAQIERTRTRPIPRGAITPRAAVIFACTQAIGAAAFLLFLPRDASIATIPTIIGTIYYPWAKRHTHLPQLVLGFCLTWGIMIGSSGMGVPSPWTDASTVSLLVASILWVVVFDTIYAHQDLADDLKVGVKSTAVFIQGFAKPALWLLFLGMTACLVSTGYYGGMGLPYYSLTVVGCVISVGSMVAKVDLEDPASCWRWFSQGFWLTGAAIASGLLAEYGVLSSGLLGL
ncbi:4-hydroxybenzoate polyprenyltransferase, mitochondrial [Colletotrichum spaethianum]|uniref:4-hydroxybenzoate polyprenyltransferase, mitochondrial n=1 Tax=Colletotrichum spaethianum TaxID=700344 RepID=A0AA37L772_9PEZI|nr:4-hydroxybenzoate polyprenyltransferase, mitochondrial [Colletotrichum spaethianum]GKT43286.1 4-hydroxybenzoate polyprenyltransferase, mitochondrial [Colletotrichum spaethianum]